ncbi:hypothetical protein [Alienimonas chondri]|uniref:hypothetical protein n=1 Tax=Alienimonas chondri TaxID=2681879 RepID=UPI001488E189|nr:hypothetical protein [Alienimonas chondri]
MLNGAEEPVRCDAVGTDRPETAIVFTTLAGHPAPAKDAVRLTADEPTNSAPPGAAETLLAVREGRTSQPASLTRDVSAKPRPRIAQNANGYRTNGDVNGPAVRGDGRPDSPPDHDELLERVSALGSMLSGTDS